MGKINLKTMRFPYWQKILISLYYGEKNISNIMKDTKCTYNYTYQTVGTLAYFGVVDVKVKGRESICKLNHQYFEFAKELIQLREKVEAKQNDSIRNIGS